MINSVNSFLPLEILNAGSKELRFLYIFVFLTSVYIFSRVFTLNSSIIFGIIIGIYLIYQIFTSYQQDVTDLNKVIIQKLFYLDNIMEENTIRQQTDIGLRIDSYIPGFESSVDVESYLYLNPNLINLLFSIRDYEKYSPQNYNKVLKITNYVLKLQFDMELKDPSGKTALRECSRNFQVAQYLVKTASNYFHSFIYSLPVEKTYSIKFISSMNRYRVLTKRILDKMKIICEQQEKDNGISAKTIFIGPEYEGPKPKDMLEDPIFDRFD